MVERQAAPDWGFEINPNQTLDALVHELLNHALVRLGAEAGSLMLVDEDQGILQVKARLGPPRPGRRSERVFKLGEGVAGRVAESRESHLCEDVQKDSAFETSRSGLNFRSLLSVPITHGNRAIAVINADDEKPGRFSEEDRQNLEQVARDVAEPMARKIGILDALLDVGKHLTRLPRRGGVEIVLQQIADAAVGALGADVVTVYQYDQARDEFLVEGTGPTIAGKLREESPMRTKVYPEDVPSHMVRRRTSSFYVDVTEQAFLKDEVSRPGVVSRPRFVDREGIKSMAALLLPFSAAESGEEIVGVMFANYRKRHDFSIDEIKALRTFADFAAVAILNARNDERRVRESTEVVEAIQGSTSSPHESPMECRESRGEVPT